MGQIMVINREDHKDMDLIMGSNNSHKDMALIMGNNNRDIKDMVKIFHHSTTKLKYSITIIKQLERNGRT